MSAASFVHSGPVVLALPVAVAAGVVSFLSPCVLPLVPGYLSYVTGLSGAELRAEDRRSRAIVLAGAALFIVGFSAPFVLEGALFGTFGQTLKQHTRTLEVVFGSITVVLGLLFAGAFSRVTFAQREWKLHLRPGVGLGAAPFIGVLFGIGWTPCVGPTLGSVLGLATASTTPTAARGAVLSAAYCLGLGLPFLLVALAFNRALNVLAVVKRHTRAVLLVGGGLLVVVGVLEIAGTWNTWAHQIQSHLGNGAQL
ncbi:MAG TPA: cytochrome c biogenesis CcdA family protein [Mycobacteriales bacterium]|nr:cytochrome c biogenesis CcdA family protein [Mycobacteriales bacterium]